MELHEVDVFIEADGEVRVEVRGMPGGSCLVATAALEAALGADVVSREVTPDLRGAEERRNVREL